jgi:hypothetical protein
MLFLWAAAENTLDDAGGGLMAMKVSILSVVASAATIGA